MFLLLVGIAGVSPRLRAQALHQPTFPAALIRLIQQDFNERFRQALDRRHKVRWSNFDSLQRAIATGNFRPELITLPGRLAPPEIPLPPPSETRRLAARPQAEGNTPTPQVQGRRGNHVQENNPHPSPHMQVEPGFNIRTDINAAAADRADTPQIDNGCHFCLLYHLKGVCNTHCGSRHSHIPISKIKFGTLGEWRDP